MAHHNHKLSTTIRMGSLAQDLHMVDHTTGEDHLLDLSKATRQEKARLAGIICKLHGITNGRRKAKAAKPNLKATYTEEGEQVARPVPGESFGFGTELDCSKHKVTATWHPDHVEVTMEEVPANG